MNSTSEIKNEDIGFAKITEVAKYLNISKAMVNKMLHQGQIPYTKFGKVYRIPWSWLKQAAKPQPIDQ
jgi:excisionase family DNA binding protein